MNLLVVGDVMTDIDITCEIVKWYGDAPVLRELSRIERPGGAANVAEMCKALGAEVLLCGVLDTNREPTIKRRFLVEGNLIARHDTETTAPYLWSIAEQAILLDFLSGADGVIVADHGKGFVQRTLLEMACCSDVPVFIDPVPTTPVVHGDNITWIGSDSEIPTDMRGRKIIKLGRDGVRFFTCEHGWQTLPSECLDCVDDVGAGDQFIASFAVAMVSGCCLSDAVYYANRDAGEQCRRTGIRPVTHLIKAWSRQC